MVISNFRQPRIAAGKKACFTIENRMKGGWIYLKTRYRLIRQPLWGFAELEVDEAEIDLLIEPVWD